MPPFLNVPSSFLALPIVGSDTIVIFRQNNYTKPLVVTYSDLVAQIIASVPSGSGLITSVSDTADIDLSVAAGVLTALLTATGVTAGTYGDSTHVPQIVVDAKGRITSVTSVAISTGGTGTVTSVGATAGTGISVSVANPTTTPVLTITNTAPDQTVTLTAGVGITISGTYPNFTITNSQSLSGYVPYTGATTDVDLGNNNISAKGVRITGTAGNGDLHLKHQSADATATGSSTSLFANSNGDLKWKNDGAFYVTLQAYTNTANRIYTLPDASGTIALVSNLASYVPYTGATANVNLGTNTITANQIIKSGGTSSQFLKADGSVDSNTYLTAAITSINSLIAAAQTLATGTSGTDFAIVSSGSTHTFNLPTASASNRGALSSSDWTTFNNKGNGTVTSVAALTLGTSGTDLSSTVANSTTTPVITLNVPTASAVNRGVLSSADWIAFNSKQQALGVPFVTMQESYPVATNQTGIAYVASASKLYVCNFGSNTVSILDTTTGATLATISVTGAFQPFYIASIGEVWITSTSLTTINRISVTLNSSLGTITGATVNGADYVEYSSTKVFICCNNASGSIMLINPSTLSVTSTITTSVPANPQGMALNTNVASSQYDKIIIAAGAGVAILNPSTNAISTTLANPSSAVSTGVKIRYISYTNQYVIANYGASNILVLDIASATTFTLNSTIRNIPGVLDVAVDETNEYLFTVETGLTSAAVLFASVIDFTTKKIATKISTNVLSGSATTSGRIALDLTNSRFFACGRSSNTNVVTSIKYV